MSIRSVTSRRRRRDRNGNEKRKSAGFISRSPSTTLCFLFIHRLYSSLLSLFFTPYILSLYLSPISNSRSRQFWSLGGREKEGRRREGGGILGGISYQQPHNTLLTLAFLVLKGLDFFFESESMRREIDQRPIV